MGHTVEKVLNVSTDFSRLSRLVIFAHSSGVDCDDGGEDRENALVRCRQIVWTRLL